MLRWLRLGDWWSLCRMEARDSKQQENLNIHEHHIAAASTQNMKLDQIFYVWFWKRKHFARTKRESSSPWVFLHGCLALGLWKHHRSFFHLSLNPESLEVEGLKAWVHQTILQKPIKNHSFCHVNFQLTNNIQPLGETLGCLGTSSSLCQAASTLGLMYWKMEKALEKYAKRVQVLYHPYINHQCCTVFWNIFPFAKPPKCLKVHLPSRRW